MREEVHGAAERLPVEGDGETESRICRTVSVPLRVIGQLLAFALVFDLPELC